LLPPNIPEYFSMLLQNLWEVDRARRPNAATCYTILNQVLLPLISSSYDIFFSHPWISKPFLCHVYHFLSATGYKVWYDQKDMGHDLNQSMRTGIVDSNIILVCLNEAYQNSTNCLKELRWAKQENKTTVVIVTQANLQSWVNLEVRSLCDLDGFLFVDLSDAAALNWNDDGSLVENQRILRQKLKALVHLFMELKCYPSLQQEVRHS
jgi:hypothetical protein